MSITVGFEKATSFVLNRDPKCHAVLEVKVGKESELSRISICSSSRGGIGIAGSEAIFAYYFRAMSR